MECLTASERFGVASPARGGAPEQDPRPTYADVAGEFDIEVTKVTNALHAMRKRLREIVLDLVRETSGNEAEFQAEVAMLLGVGSDLK